MSRLTEFPKRLTYEQIMDDLYPKWCNRLLPQLPATKTEDGFNRDVFVEYVAKAQYDALLPYIEGLKAQLAKSTSVVSASAPGYGEAREKIKKFLQRWVADYKDVSERHALAEDPDESADYLTDQILAIRPNYNDAIATKYSQGYDDGVREGRKQVIDEEIKPWIIDVLRLAIDSSILCTPEKAENNNCVACKIFYQKLTDKFPDWRSLIGEA